MIYIYRTYVVEKMSLEYKSTDSGYIFNISASIDAVKLSYDWYMG